jgi:hypothetical protein
MDDDRHRRIKIYLKDHPEGFPSLLLIDITSDEFEFDQGRSVGGNSNADTSEASEIDNATLLAMMMGETLSSPRRLSLHALTN